MPSYRDHTGRPHAITNGQAAARAQRSSTTAMLALAATMLAVLGVVTVIETAMLDAHHTIPKHSLHYCGG